MVVIVFGLPGSGKSYFASWLANLINADYVNSDRLRKEIPVPGSYSEKEKLAVYDEMRKRMKKHITQNSNLIIDATFYIDEIRKKFIEDAGGGTTIFFIEIKADEDLTNERLKGKRAYSEADLNVHKKIKQEWEPMSEPHLVLHSTNDNLPGMLQQTMSYLHYNDDKRTDK